MTGIYRVPLRRVFRKTHMPGDPSWDDIYGHKKCVICRKHFSEGQPYRTNNDGTYEHVECPSVARLARKVKK